MARTRFVDLLAIYAEVHMNHALNGSSAIQHFKHSYVIEIRDENIFDFYMLTVMSFVNPFMYSSNHFTDTRKMKAKNPRGLKLQTL